MVCTSNRQNIGKKLSSLYTYLLVRTVAKSFSSDGISGADASYSKKLESFLGKSDEYIGIFFVGGHGPMFDLAVDSTSHALIREFYESDKLVSAVCHGPAALANVKLSDGTYMVGGQAVTGFSNAEEDAYKFTDAMPFLLEDKLQEHGGKYEKADQLFGVKVVTSGKSENLITGQNPPSAGVIGKVLLEAIRSRAS
ncbi:hypothetical protein CEP52_007017 [Fusarium oligoseptatum]|uniref:D-lactate dehydratase n=1 Tax=Fusarium oligoseptatum TaxID=2604345 RepID=A0A428TQ03_9HYPO|nr:hypothetical protein CEP52_007017 [Fusarium oligoseptatum]